MTVDMVSATRRYSDAPQSGRDQTTTHTRAYALRRAMNVRAYAMNRLPPCTSSQEANAVDLYVWVYTTLRIPSGTAADNKVLSSHAYIGIHNRPYATHSHQSRFPVSHKIRQMTEQ